MTDRVDAAIEDRAGEERNMTELEILTAVRDLLSDPTRWTQGTFARDARGEPSHDWNTESCWCLAGAIYRVAISDDYGMRAEEFVSNVTGVANIRLFNDHPNTTHESVLAVLDQAIGYARSIPAAPGTQVEGDLN